MLWTPFLRPFGGFDAKTMSSKQKKMFDPPRPKRLIQLIISIIKTIF